MLTQSQDPCCFSCCPASEHAGGARCSSCWEGTQPGQPAPQDPYSRSCDAVFSEKTSGEVLQGCQCLETGWALASQWCAIAFCIMCFFFFLFCLFCFCFLFLLIVLSISQPTSFLTFAFLILFPLPMEGEAGEWLCGTHLPTRVNTQQG